MTRRKKEPKLKLSLHQGYVIRRMQQGAQVWQCVIHISTIRALEEKGLLEKVEGKWALTEEGKQIKF